MREPSLVPGLLPPAVLSLTASLLAWGEILLLAVLWPSCEALPVVAVSPPVYHTKRLVHYLFHHPNGIFIWLPPVLIRR